MSSEPASPSQAKVVTAPPLPAQFVGASTHTFPAAIRSSLATVGRLEDFERALAEGGEFHARLELPPYNPLSIETIGRANSGAQRVAVMQFFIQNGDLMRDPEIVFEVYSENGNERWVPCELTQHPVGLYQDAYDDTGMTLLPGKARGFLGLANLWAGNLRDQGWTTMATLAPERGAAAAEPAEAATEDVVEETSARRR